MTEGLGSDSPLRAGWLLIRPSLTDFEEMKTILQNGIFDEELGWEGLGVPASYSGWNRTSDNHMWDFYGAQLEQGGILEYTFQFIFMKFCHVMC